jgi:hypothetical protein
VNECLENQRPVNHRIVNQRVVKQHVANESLVNRPIVNHRLVPHWRLVNHRLVFALQQTVFAFLKLIRRPTPNPGDVFRAFVNCLVLGQGRHGSGLCGGR